MRLVSVNVGKAQPLESSKGLEETGIFKEPVLGPVQVTSLGLVGDEICETESHGGVDQAVYVYGVEDYAWWENELGHPLKPGTFGENLTISDLESAYYLIGNRFLIGDVILEVSAARIPCGTLAARMGDPKFARRFQLAERPGLYCRVIQEGLVQVGDAVTMEPYVGETVTAIGLFRNFYRREQDAATLWRYLAAPIAIRARNDIERLLQKILE